MTGIKIIYATGIATPNMCYTSFHTNSAKYKSNINVQFCCYLRIVVKRCWIVVLHVLPSCSEECERVELVMAWLFPTADQLLVIEQLWCELKQTSL